MELKNYITILLRRKWVIVLTIAAVLSVVFIGARLQTPVYESSVTIRVSASSSGQLSYSSTSFVAQLLNTTAQIATSSKVLSELTSHLGLNHTPEVTSEVIPGTELIKITVADPDPKTALNAAVTIVEILVSQSDTLYTGGGSSAVEVLGAQLAEVESELLKTNQEYAALMRRISPSPAEADLLFQKLTLQQRNYDSLLTQYQQAQYLNAMRADMITVIDQPLLPKSPSKPRLPYYMLIGMAVGVLGGVVLAFVLDNFDTTLYSRKDIELTSGMETLSSIPKVRPNQTTLDVLENSAFSDSFQKLAYNILQFSSKSPLKTILVLSPEPGEGKSLVTAHLAAALAEHGKNVVVVDCNLRKPQLHQWFGISNTAGLKNVIEEDLEQAAAIQKTRFNNLLLLPSGGKAIKPALLLSSLHMKDLMTELVKNNDYILIDTPALSAAGDVEVLSEFADGFVLVVQRKMSSREAVKAAGEFISRFPDKMSALVVNHDNIKENNSRRKGFPFTLISKVQRDLPVEKQTSTRLDTSNPKPGK